MSTTYGKFNDYIEKEIKDINFMGLYDSLNETETYQVNRLVEVIRYVSYYLENKKRLNPSLGEFFAYHIAVLKGEVPLSKYSQSIKQFEKIEILNLIQVMDSLINQKKSSDNLYI